MKTGVVIEITAGKAVVMTSAGQFVQVKAQSGWQTGDVVHVGTARSQQRTWGYLAACCALIMLSVGGYRFYMLPQVLISIDVNPSIELSLNRLDRVVETKALNPEAEAILAQATIKHQRYDQALTALLAAEEMAGYLQDDSEVVLTVYADDAIKQAAVFSGARQCTNEALAHHYTIGVEAHQVDGTLVQEAHGCGVTAGKYLYLQQLQEADPAVDITEYTHHSINELKGEIESCRSGAVFDEQQRDHHRHHQRCR